MDKILKVLKKWPMPTQGVLLARLLVGGYLIYLSKSLFDERLNAESSMNPIVLYGFMVIFLIVGLFLCVKAILHYVTGYYKGGKLDTDETSGQSGEINDGTDDGADVIDVKESEIEELDK